MKRTSSVRPFRPHWDLYSVSIVALFVFYQVMQWPLLPKFVDIYYHLAVVRGFSDAGGWVGRDYWEFAPLGRPHLYPPFLHAWLLIPYRLGFDPIDIGRAVDVLSYPALLVSFWILVRSRGGARAAFWATLLFSSVYSSFLASVTLSAFNLGMIGALWAFYFLGAGRPVAAGLAAAAVCYTHTMAAGMDAALRRNTAKALALALFLSLPILAWQFSNRGAFEFIRVGENNLIELDPFLYAIAALRIARSLLRRKPDVWPIAIFLAMLPVVPLRQARVIGGYGVCCAAWLAALEIISWLDAVSRARGKITAVSLGVLIAVFFSFFAPTYLTNLERGGPRLQWTDRSLVRYLVPDETRDFRAKGFSIYFEKEYAEILDVMRDRLKPGEVFWTDFPHAGGILYLKTGRAMSTAMMGEVGSWKDREARLRNAKLLIWFKTGDGRMPAEVPQIVQKMGLTPVASTKISDIFENPHGGSHTKNTSPVIPIAYVWTLLALWSGALSYATFRRI